jgi:hypothetical protein
MPLRYRFYLLDENSRVLGSLHGEFATDDAALGGASAMLKGSMGVEVWQEDRLVGRLTHRRETVDQVLGALDRVPDRDETDERRPAP